MLMRNKRNGFDQRMRTAILAGGLAALVAPVAPASAADLNMNLVVNPGFENVNTGDSGPFTSVRILDWIDSDGDNDDTFAYPYTSGYSGGNVPANAGDYHYSGGFGTAAGQALVSQTLDLTTGLAADTIGTGIAVYDLSAFFSGYLTQDDASGVRARFLGVGGVELGTASVGGYDFFQSIPLTDGNRDWTQDVGRGAIPQGTQSVSIEVFAGDADANHDGYADLVDFRVIKPDVLTLRINPTTGNGRLSNNSSSALEIDYYELRSASGSLDPTGWTSLMDQDYEGNGPPNTPRTGDGWEEAGGSSPAILSESFLQGGSIIGVGQSIDLGHVHNGGDADAVLYFGTVDGTLYRGLVEFSSIVLGDMDGSGTLDAFDVPAFELALADKAAYITAYPGLDPDVVGDMDGSGQLDAFDVPTFEGALASVGQSVPEPTVLTLLAFGGLALLRRRRA